QREGAQIHAWRRDGPALGPSDRHLLGAQGPDSGREDHRQRFGCNLISTLTNYGTLRFQVFEGSFTTEVFLDFLRRLVRSVPRKVFLIVDRHPVHRAHRVQQWVAQHSDQIELFYLPPYRPEHNPEEYFHQEILAHARRQGRLHHAAGLKRMVRTYLHRIQQWREK
ncbi:MAG: IS630 family transposase, partial [Cyanobacteria bacterium QH_6_48_35]